MRSARKKTKNQHIIDKDKQIHKKHNMRGKKRIQHLNLQKRIQHLNLQLYQKQGKNEALYIKIEQEKVQRDPL